MSNKMRVMGTRLDKKTGIPITSLALVDEQKPCKQCKKNPRAKHSSRCAECKANHVKRQLDQGRLEKKIQEQQLQK